MTVSRWRIVIRAVLVVATLVALARAVSVHRVRAAGTPGGSAGCAAR